MEPEKGLPMDTVLVKKGLFPGYMLVFRSLRAYREASRALANLPPPCGSLFLGGVGPMACLDSCVFKSPKLPESPMYGLVKEDTLNHTRDPCMI